jgi:hypothetical protein
MKGIKQEIMRRAIRRPSGDLLREFKIAIDYTISQQIQIPIQEIIYRGVVDFREQVSG